MLGGRGGRFCITESCKIYLPLFALSPIFIGEGEVDFAAQRAAKSTSLFLVFRLEQSVSRGETLATLPREGEVDFAAQNLPPLV